MGGLKCSNRTWNERCSVPEVRGSSRQLDSEGRNLQPGIGPVRRRWKLEAGTRRCRCRSKSTTEKHDSLKRIQLLRDELKAVEKICLPGCDALLVDSAIAGVEGMIEQLEIIKKKI